jgi:hypothetical protein
VVISVTLTNEEMDALRQLAEVERRPTRDQAAYLVSEGLTNRGLILARQPKCQRTTSAIGSASAADSRQGVADASA